MKVAHKSREAFCFGAMKRSSALTNFGRSGAHAKDVPLSRDMILKRLGRLNFPDHYKEHKVFHAKNFLNLSRSWNFESLHFWLANICNFSNTTVLSRRAGDRKARRMFSTEMAFKAVSGGERSLQIGGLNRVLGPSDPLMKVYSAIQECLGVAVEEIGMFFSPPSQRAIARHLDEIDVLTIQLQGTKRWDIWTDANLEDSGRRRPSFSVNLHPGSILFVPAFVPHSVVAGSDESLSAAFPLYPRSYRELLPELLYKLPSIATLLEKTVPESEEVTLAREQLKKLTSALVAISDDDLSSAIAAVRHASAQGKRRAPSLWLERR